MEVEEERQPRSEAVDVEPAFDRRLHVADAVRQREGQLLRRGRAGLADVVARDGDGMPARRLAGAELDHVDDDAHRRRRRRDPFFLRDELLEHVVLDGAAQLVQRNVAALRHGEVHRQQDAGAAVHRHRGGHAVERNVGEQRFHVRQGGDGDAFAADLAEGARVVGVVAHERRHVEGRREPCLPLFEQELEALVRILRRPEAGKLAHGPELAAIHARVGAARERILARMPKLVVV